MEQYERASSFNCRLSELGLFTGALYKEEYEQKLRKYIKDRQKKQKLLFATLKKSQEKEREFLESLGFINTGEWESAYDKTNTQAFYVWGTKNEHC